MATCAGLLENALPCTASPSPANVASLPPALLPSIDSACTSLLESGTSECSTGTAAEAYPRSSPLPESSPSAHPAGSPESAPSRQVHLRARHNNIPLDQPRQSQSQQPPPTYASDTLRQLRIDDSQMIVSANDLDLGHSKRALQLARRTIIGPGFGAAPGAGCGNAVAIAVWKATLPSTFCTT